VGLRQPNPSDKHYLRVAASRKLLPEIIWYAATALLLGVAWPAAALEPSTPLANLGRQAWAMENGLPQNTVQALAQTKDGFLWLGTEAGLVRFDGIEFETYDRNSTPALPGSDIRCLLVARDGALWIGTNAGLARWKDGAVKTYTTQDGLPGNGILALVETSDGVVWAWTEAGLVRLKGAGFVPSDDGIPASAITSVHLGPQGQLWVEAGSSAAIYQGGGWIDEYEYFKQTTASIAYWSDLPHGEFAFGTIREVDVAHGDRKIISPENIQARLAVGRELPGSRIQAVFADRENALWIGTNAGLVRWVSGKVERFPITDPLSTASILAVMEDNEGNLWVGTETGGLDILRDQRFRTIDTRDGLTSDRVTTVVEDATGTLWAGTQEDGLNALRRDEGSAELRAVRSLTVSNGLASNVILSLAAAPNGDLWVGTPDGLNRIRGSKVDTFTSADGLPDDFVRSLLIDTDGSLWIGTRRGLAHWAVEKRELSRSGSGAGMETYTHASGLGSDLVGAMARDTHGDLWVATLAGLSRLHGNTISNFTARNGLSSNVVTALLPRADGTLLIGTQDHGWNVWDGSKFSRAMSNGIEETTIHAILDDGAGHLWFATGDGIARCDCGEMSGAGPAGSCSHWMEFGTADGLESRETANNSHPSAWRSRDGRLWFATAKGLVEVAPAHFPVNVVPPPVSLERFQVDDVAQPLRGADSWLKVAAGRVHFEFDYAGLSFVAPQKVRYRYMLEGFDRGWTDAGTRRTAYYTNIPPGRYTFRVQAANNDGLWNTTGAALSFELRPHFYQTLWFYALLLLALAGTVLLVLKRRLYVAEREFKAVLGERSRIAREIHDTLAQGYVGVSVQLEVLAELLRQRKTEDAGKQLDQTRDYVRHGLADARQSIWALRTQDASETTMPVKLRRMAEGAGGDGLTARFSLFGAYRPLPADTEREVARIAQEAIQNVKKHAGASELSVQLEYGPEAVTLEVRDDGRGGATERTAATSPGHFGLTGMRERAAEIGATLEVSSMPGEGTTIRLSVPARSEAREQAEVKQ
jgi:ligand-binding sensor domain-containing protein/signal transduction histidine kinase